MENSIPRTGSFEFTPVVNIGSDPFNTFLSSSQVYTAIRREIPEVIQFVKENLIILLDICFSDESPNKSNNAFLLIANSPKEILEQLLVDDLLFSKVSSVLLSPNPTEISISRIASILQSVLSKISKPTNSCVSLFFQLLPFIENQGVFDLFISVTVSTSPFVEFLQMLEKTSFGSLFLLEFENNCSKIKIANLCRIVRHGCHNPILGKSFRTVEMIDKLVPFLLIKEKDEIVEERYLRNNLWQAISAYTANDTVNNLRKVVPIALDILCNEPVPVLHSYHTFCIDFLAKMISFDPVHLQDFKEYAFLSALQDFMIRFADSTNFQGAIFRFIRNSLKWSQSAEAVMKSTMDLLVDICSSDVRNAAKSNSLLLMSDIYNEAVPSTSIIKMLKKKYYYKTFKKNILKPFEEILNAKYGGSTQVPQQSPPPKQYVSVPLYPQF